jgi:hypothetical protein
LRFPFYGTRESGITGAYRRRATGPRVIIARCILLTCVFVVGAIACAVQGEQTQGQRLRLVPQNEAIRAPGFASTLARFETAVGARDVAAVREIGPGRVPLVVAAAVATTVRDR